MASYNDPDEATAALIALIIAEDLDAKDIADSYHSTYPQIYDEEYNNHGDGYYAQSGEASYLTDPTVTTANPAGGTSEHYASYGESSYPGDPVSAEAPNGTWDASSAAFPGESKCEKKIAAASQHHQRLTKANDAPSTTSSNLTPVNGASSRQSSAIRTTAFHEDLPTTSNAPGKRRAHSPPAVRHHHRRQPPTRSPTSTSACRSQNTSNPHPHVRSPKGKRRAAAPSPPSEYEWGTTTPGTEDWELLELEVPWPGMEAGSVQGLSGMGTREIEEEQRRREDASVVEIRVGEDEDLWSLLGDLSVEEEKMGRGEGVTVRLGGMT